MKCICGYEHEEEFDNEDRYYKTINGDDKFKEICGTFLIEDDDYYKLKREVSIYACPKCGTLKIEI